MIVIATNNKAKLNEFRELFNDSEQVLSLNDIGFNAEIEETGITFQENSYIKAKTIYDFCHLPVIADDSGICVKALNDAPGVFSARFASMNNYDGDNIDLLLEKLKTETDRSAYFFCCLTYIDANGKVYYFNGQTDGTVLHERTGEKGFGYDPVFYSNDLRKSFGLATDDEKNSVSHRGRAIQEFFKFYKTL